MTVQTPVPAPALERDRAASATIKAGQAPQGHMKAGRAASATFRATHDEAEMELLSNLSYGARWRLAVEDLAEGLRLSQLFRTLGWLDIKTRYRGSVLGPFWLTLSTAVMVGALGTLQAALFHVKIRDFMPFIALSLVLWGYLSSLITDACVVFTSSETTIRSVRMPYFVFAGQNVHRNILILGHNLVVIVGVFAIFQISPGWNALACLPALLLWLIDSFAVTILLGAFCARFRDVPPIVGSILQIAFYVSPIIWKPELLHPSQRTWLPYDPFYSLFEIVRAPLLGTIPATNVWISAAAFSVLLCVVAWLGFVRVRSRIAFWI
jgi:lipopolysaccharide transport system permease protein